MHILKTFSFFLLFCLSSFSQTLFPIFISGPTSNRVNIAILSEAYTVDQFPFFRQNATNLTLSILSEPALADYKNLFNFYGIEVASNENGADHPNLGIYKDTYFGATYYYYNIDRLLVVVQAYKATAILNSLLPERDAIIFSVNDPQYGGSGGYNLTTSVHPLATEIVRHEMGHSYAGLGDEYSSPYPGYPSTEEPNTTTNQNRNTLKWGVWVKPSTPIPTPTSDGEDIGLFEGAHYFYSGWFRPKLDCKMKSLGQPFCEVCAEKMILSTYYGLKIIENHFPASSTFSLPPEGVSLSINQLIPTNFVQYIWFINDTAISTNTSLTVQSSNVNLGTNKIQVLVRDGSPRLRANIEDRFEWTVINNTIDKQMPKMTGVLEIRKL